MDPSKKYNATSGKLLEDEVNKAHQARQPIIEGFLYEHSILMVASDPGLGKSILMTSAFAQMSAGLPVWSSLFVPHPMKCYKIPFERGLQEDAERLKHMQNTIPIVWENLFINENFIGLDVTNSKHADFIIDTIRKDCPNPNVVGLDPIYASVAGGLSTDEKASQFCRFSARLQHEFNCSVWLNHHTVKAQLNRDGDVTSRPDPFYGSQWLKAHVTASYHLKEGSDGGILLDKKKDSHGNLISLISLGYNADDYTSYAIGIEQASTKKEKALIFFRTCYTTKKQFTFKEFVTSLGGVWKGVYDSYARELLRTPPFDDAHIKHKSTGGSTIHEVTKLI